PLVVGLRCGQMIEIPDSPPVHSRLELTFPSSKSWIEADWTVEDPDDQIECMGIDFDLLLSGWPRVWDCGASSTVYGTLRDGERMTFEASGESGHSGLEASWVIRQGAADRLNGYALAAGDRTPPAEGWIHVMDPSRCTAMAVADFGQAGAAALDRFEVSAGG